MKLIFIGPQGSGKGTQAIVLAKNLNIPHISTGDLLRSVKGKLKEEVDNFMHTGKLVPDNLIINILKERISKKDCSKGLILDGFPRSLEQAKALDAIITIDKVIEISITDEEAIKRIRERISCQNCSAVYNLSTNPPKEENVCDRCNSQLTRRKDDTEEAIKKRLEIYHKETKPLLDHYDHITINGDQPINKVTEDILKELS